MKTQQFARSAMVLVGWSLALNVWAFGDKPLKVIVPGPPGGTIDTAARVVGQQMSVDIGRPVIIENRAGATGSIGLSAMLKADPDGNTIALGPSNLLVEAPLVMKVPYDPLNDIVSIARVALTSYVLVTSATYPAKDFQGLVAHLKTRKGKANFASYGTGTVSQYSGLIFMITVESSVLNVLPVNMIGIALGLHVRCGIEDVLWNQTRTGKMSSVEQIKQLVRISTEFGRPIATAQQAREIMKIGVFYETADETLRENGFAPNRNGGNQGFLRKPT